MNRRTFLRYMLTSAALLVPRFVSGAEYSVSDLGILLTVPFAAQQYTGDCGETCFHMLSLWRADLRGVPRSHAYTPAQIRDVWGKSADEYALWHEHMWQNMGELGFTGICETAWAGEDWYREQLALGRPSVALTFNASGQSHYVVVVAADANGLIVHDPNGYELLPVSSADWLTIGQNVGIAITGIA